MIWWINEEVFIVDLFSTAGGPMFALLTHRKPMYLKNKQIIFTFFDVFSAMGPESLL